MRVYQPLTTIVLLVLTGSLAQGVPSVSTSDCLGFLRSIAQDPLDRTGTLGLIWPDAVGDGIADLVVAHGKSTRTISQEHKHEAIRIQHALRILYADPAADSTEIAKLEARRNELIGTTPQSREEGERLLAEKFAVRIVLPKNGINPFPSWDEEQPVTTKSVKRHDGTIDEILNDGLFVRIPSGTVHYVSPHNTSRQAEIGKGIWMGVFPVTQLQWTLLMGWNPSGHSRRGLLKANRHIDAHRPVETVNAVEAEEFVRRLNTLERDRWKALRDAWVSEHPLSAPEHYPGKYFQYRLPTEAEHFWSAMGGETEAQWDALPGGPRSRAWVGVGAAWLQAEDIRLDSTEPVGTKLPNNWGIYDGFGNVYEWTNTVPFDDPGQRVYRGGGYGSTTRHAYDFARFDQADTPFKTPEVGLRLVREEYPR